MSRRGGSLMLDTPEKRIARAEELEAIMVNPDRIMTIEELSEIVALIPALAADAKRAIRYERNLCSIAKVLTDAGVPLTVETADGPTIDRINERVALLVDEIR